MTKKDYELMAEVLERESKSGEKRLIQVSYENIVDCLAVAFAQDNPMFNRTKFLTACGITE